MTYFLSIEIAMGLATIALALYRKLISMGEENIIHLGPGQEMHVLEQANLARRLHRVDRCGEAMTVATAAGGILLAIFYLIRAWETSALAW
ncbi:MAG TPA: hypothetical protein VH639_12205 [Bryobacteraceae bacterium]|jgi:hypothetical protein